MHFFDYMGIDFVLMQGFLEIFPSRIEFHVSDPHILVH